VADLLDITGSCIAALLELEPRDRQRVMSALHAVLDLTDHDERARTVVVQLREEEPGLVSPHFACAPEDVHDTLEPDEVPPPAAPKAKRHSSNTRWATASAAAKHDAILDAVNRSPNGATPKEVATKVGLQKDTVSWHLRRLFSENMIAKLGTGNQTRYMPIGTAR